MAKTLPENQQQIADGLHVVTTILENNGIPYIIEGGTLLGAVRENRFLPWDDDVGIAVPSELFHGKIDLLLKELIDSGFTAGYRDNTFENCKINVIRDDARYEILGWFARGSWRRRARYRMPRNFLENRKLIPFFGYNFYCPENAVQYLRHFYGNWKVPKKSGRIFSFYCFDQKMYWKRQFRKVFPFLFPKKS